MSPQQVADRAGVDPGTVRDFADGLRWAWSSTRRKLEDAVGLDPGDLERAARDELQDQEDRDPVVAAIEQSGLSRAERAELVAHYYRLVDSQERGAAG